MALTLNNFVGAETQGLEESSASTGSPTVSTSVPRSGTANFFLNSLASLSFPWVVSGVTDAGADYVFSVAFRETTVVSPSATAAVVEVLDDSGGVIISLRKDTSGNVGLYDANDSQLGTAELTTTAGIWYFIEVYAQLNNASGSWEWFVDGTSKESGSGADLTDGNAFGSSSSVLRLYAQDSGSAQLFDDIYILSGASASSDAFGNAEVFAYQNTAEDATDQGDALATGTWALVSETPLNEGSSNEASYVDTGTLTGSTICDEGDRAGPSGDANIDGDSSIKGAKWVGRFKRGSGTGRTHSFLIGNSGDGVTAKTIALETAYATTEYLSEAAGEVPLTTESFQHGFSKDLTAGQDIFCGDIWAMLLHVPAAVAADPAIDTVLFMPGQHQPVRTPPEVVGY